MTIVSSILAAAAGMALVFLTDDPEPAPAPPPKIMVVPETRTVTVESEPIEVIPAACTRLAQELATVLKNTSKVSATQGALGNLLSDVASGIHEGMDPTDIVDLKQQARDLQTELTGAFVELGQAQYYVDKNQDACS